MNAFVDKPNKKRAKKNNWGNDDDFIFADTINNGLLVCKMFFMSLDEGNTIASNLFFAKKIAMHGL